jgi:hypothetical protein
MRSRLLAAQWIALTLILGLAGCQTQTPGSPSLAPFDARLELVPGGGARHFVVINTSGQELHNYSFSAYMWNDKNAMLFHNDTHRFIASGATLQPGQALRFHGFARTAEELISEPVSRVEIVGHCTEGSFRQVWQYTDSDQLEPMTAKHL